MTDQITEEVEEVRDPQGLLASYNKLKGDIAALRSEYENTQKTLDALKAEYAESEVRGRAILAEAKLALHQQGFKDVERLMPYIGTDALDFDEEGHLTGLDDRLNVLKKDLPEVFDPKVRVGGKADIHADTPVEVQKNPLREALHNALNA